MGCRVTAFSRSKTEKEVNEIKQMGAVEVVRSDDK